MITARPLVETDLPAVVALLHAEDRRWFGEPLLTPADVAAEWASPDFDLATDSEGWVEGDVLVAFGTLGTRGGIELAVDQSWQDAGLEDALLQRWETDARRRGSSSVHRHLAVSDLPGRARLEGRGWSLRRTGWLLTLRPDVPVPPRPVPDGYELRPLREPDLPATYAVVVGAFVAYGTTPRSYEDWRAGTIDRPDVTLGHCWVATCGGAVVGTCLVIDPVSGDRGADADDEAWVPIVAVATEHRRRGLARELLARTALDARERGVRRVGLYTHEETGALGLYEGLGMVVRGTLLEYELALER